MIDETINTIKFLGTIDFTTQFYKLSERIQNMDLYDYDVQVTVPSGHIVSTNRHCTTIKFPYTDSTGKEEIYTISCDGISWCWIRPNHNPRAKDKREFFKLCISEIVMFADQICEMISAVPMIDIEIKKLEESKSK